MKMNGSCLVGSLLIFGLLAMPLLAQDSATMSSPIVRTSPDKINFIVRFGNFVSGKDYRIGIGAEGVSPPEGLRLSRDGMELKVPVVKFKQGGNTSDWWGVKELSAAGYLLKADVLPFEDSQLTLRIDVPRKLADQAKRLYLFVARDYGSDTWYLEDGIDLDQQDW